MGDEQSQEMAVEAPAETTTPSPDEEAHPSSEEQQSTGLKATDENRSLIERLIKGIKKL